ncbi:MAG: phosphotriesterase, partial [Sphingobacteriaceae bacterium]
MKRRKFISLLCLTGIAGVSLWTPLIALAQPIEKTGFVMTVTGKINPAEMGATLCHEHIITDFTGAEKVKQAQYDNVLAFAAMLPRLRALKQSGVTTMVECTPAYIGRNVKLLKELSVATGLNIITNTGYYAAAGQKYLPAHAYTETDSQLAARWLKEWRNGIDGTDIRPGFIKLGVDEGPLNAVQIKLLKAAANTHLKSGLKIAIHTGNDSAAVEYTQLMIKEGVSPSALIWVHAQNDN